VDFWKSILNLARRRFLSPVLLLLGIGAAVIAYFLVPTHYVSTTSVVLTTPTNGGTLSVDPKEPNGLTNPLLQFNDGLQTTAGILILSMNTPETLAKLGVHPGGDITVTINDGRTDPDLLGISTNGPFIYVEVDSKSPAVSDATVRKAGQLIREELAGRQRALKAPPSTYIAITDVVPPARPEPERTAKWGTAAGALLAVVVAGLGLAYFVDRDRGGRRTAHVAHTPWGAQTERPAITSYAHEPGSSVNGGKKPSAPRVWDDDETAVIVVVPEEPDGGDWAGGLRLASAVDSPPGPAGGGVSGGGVSGVSGAGTRAGDDSGEDLPRTTPRAG
jgi:hypothetical protein